MQPQFNQPFSRDAQRSAWRAPNAPRCASRLNVAFVIGAVFCCTSTATAHPVPLGNHDRTIHVQLSQDAQRQEIIVTVHYRLEVDDLTVANDLIPFSGQVKREELYTQFSSLFAPVLARHLHAQANGSALVFVCQNSSHATTDETGTPLGHARFDFVFRSAFPIKPGEAQSLTFREGNYETKPGKILLFLDKTTSGLQIVTQTGPTEALQAKTPQQLGPGDDARLREITATLRLDSLATQIEPQKTPVPQTADDHHGEPSLLQLFLSSDHGLVVILLLSVVIGAAHALTPGHGKTLVAAYLVGQRGTVSQAFLLGVVTTITHTGIVLLIALGLLLVDEDKRQQVANVLSLVMGLALVCLGIWLLLQRLAGRADHFHIGGHRHHHHHEPVAAAAQPVGWTGLIVMGMTGGIAPCWDAVAMLGLAVGMNLLWLAVPMLLAFSAGLASVLVLVGILVVKARKLLDSRWSQSLVVRWLPVLSALFIAGLGLLVCYQGTHP